VTSLGAGGREAIAAYHAMRPPRNLAEHLTAAQLLGLALDRPDERGVTLRERITAYWQPAAPTTPAALPSARRVRPSAQWGAPVGNWEDFRP
jgi:hypothetical protein